MTPFNILGEISTPVSMACRHFGNIFSGIVINGLIYGALAVLQYGSPGTDPGHSGTSAFADPDFDVGIPITGFYFDWFTSCMQAFVFSMLTIMYIV